MIIRNDDDGDVTDRDAQRVFAAREVGGASCRRLPLEEEAHVSFDPNVTIPEDVLVVGATIAGLDVLDALRARAYHGRLRLLRAEASETDFKGFG